VLCDILGLHVFDVVFYRIGKKSTSQLVTRSTSHSLKSCDELTVLLNKVVTS